MQRFSLDTSDRENRDEIGRLENVISFVARFFGGLKLEEAEGGCFQRGKATQRGAKCGSGG